MIDSGPAWIRGWMFSFFVTFFYHLLILSACYVWIKKPL